MNICSIKFCVWSNSERLHLNLKKTNLKDTIHHIKLILKCSKRHTPMARHQVVLVSQCCSNRAKPRFLCLPLSNWPTSLLSKTYIPPAPICSKMFQNNHSGRTTLNQLPQHLPLRWTDGPPALDFNKRVVVRGTWCHAWSQQSTIVLSAPQFWPRLYPPFFHGSIHFCKRCHLGRSSSLLREGSVFKGRPVGFRGKPMESFTCTT